ncbi:MAG: Holliday junction branch migration protein RuvA [Clostridia bacterium]|jgi:Holliday junction DNA helicase RuvA|nr:Holliday junction branch migration protein RuvA [Clostridiales bacterium]
MISFIKGRVEDVDRDTLSIDVNGLGYRVFSSAATIGRVAPGEVVKLHTRMIVREDSISLFGFLGEDELYLFEKLITVSGIGPKVAISILSSMPPAEFATLVVEGRVEELMRVPGIGRKTGERLILELKDKLDIYGGEYKQEAMPDNRKEALEALISLGFDATGVRRALSRVDEEEADTARLIKLCLKILKS